jgi:hypothetical protein
MEEVPYKKIQIFNEENIITNFVQVYVPNKDKNDKEMPVHIYEKWIIRFKKCLMKLNEGTTTTYTEGTWVEEGIDEKGKPFRKEIFEKTAIIKSFVTDEKKFQKGEQELANLILAFGRDTNQGAVAFETRDSFQLIKDYEQGKKDK